METTLVIPAINEEESLPHVLAAIDMDLILEVLLVDGGSHDRTVEIAADHGVCVIHEHQPGYGRACAAGLSQAQGEIVVFMDADGADDPRQIPDLLAPITQSGVDMVLGSRLAGDIPPGAMPWHQEIGNRLSAALIRILYGLPITDLSPFRAVRRSQLLALDMQEMTYGWPTEMIARAARQGWSIVEVPVDYRPRLGGKSKISGTLRGTIFATYYILSTIIRYSFGGGRVE